MSDLDVVAVLKAKTGSEQIVQDALAALAVETRNEAGCISYQLYRSNMDPTTFVTIEKWDSQASLDGHLKTEHVAQALGIAGDHLQSPPDIHPLSLVG